MPDTRPLSILVADDEAPARQRLRELLAEIPGTQLVAEAASGTEALQLAQQLRRADAVFVARIQWEEPA